MGRQSIVELHLTIIFQPCWHKGERMQLTSTFDGEDYFHFGFFKDYLMH